MILNLTSAFSFFILILLSTAIFFAAKKFRLPYTVMLVLVGLLLVPIVNLPYFDVVFGFINDMVLTPELLFYIFLPVLIFESGFNMSIRRMLDSAWAISLLAVVGIIVSVFIIATGLYYIMPLIGVEMPFIMALLFGAIISPTDPVAVLSVFKEVGVPKRLSIIFEGESLINDGTAMALFLILLGVAMNGFDGGQTVLSGVFQFFIMISAGVAIGLVMAAMFSRAIRFTKNNEFVTVTLLLISAHLVFITTEIINHSGFLHVSSIIATTVSSLFLGNYSRRTLSSRTDEYLGKLIEHMAFVVNSLVFIMAGLLFANSGVNIGQLWLPILISAVIVVFARIIAVFCVLSPLNLTKLERHIPLTWQKLLAWGSLRGALSIIIVLLIPEDFHVPGWIFTDSPRDFLLGLTVGCILASLFIKAPTIIPLTKRFGLDKPGPLKRAHQADLSIFYLITELARLDEYKSKGFLTDNQHKELVKEVTGSLKDAESYRRRLVDEYGRRVFDQSLHLAMVHVEKMALKRLFFNEEVSEKIYRKISSKLSLQQEKIELAQHQKIDPKAYTDRKDVFDRLMNWVHAPFEEESEENDLRQRLEYYRAQMIMARKAVKTIDSMQNDCKEKTFLKETYEEVSELYNRYKERCSFKIDTLVDEHTTLLKPHLEQLANRSLSASGHRAMNYLRDNGLVDEEMEHGIIEACTRKRPAH